MNATNGGTTMARSPLERLARARALQQQRQSEQLQIWFGSAQRQFPVTLYGIYPLEKTLVVSAPVGADGGLVAVMRDQTVACRWSSLVAVYTFRAMVSELAHRPHPVLFLGEVNSIQRFTRRRLPRVATVLPATLHAGASPEAALLTDLSAAGAQVAVSTGMVLQPGQRVQLGLRLRLLDRDRTLRLDCSVVVDRGEPDPEHPLVHFYGVRFEDLDEVAELALLGHVQHLMLQREDSLGRLLQPGATTVERAG